MPPKKKTDAAVILGMLLWRSLVMWYSTKMPLDPQDSSESFVLSQLCGTHPLGTRENQDENSVFLPWFTIVYHFLPFKAKDFQHFFARERLKARPRPKKPKPRRNLCLWLRIWELLQQNLGFPSTAIHKNVKKMDWEWFDRWSKVGVVSYFPCLGMGNHRWFGLKPTIPGSRPGRGSQKLGTIHGIPWPLFGTIQRSRYDSYLFIRYHNLQTWTMLWVRYSHCIRPLVIYVIYVIYPLIINIHDVHHTSINGLFPWDTHWLILHPHPYTSIGSLTHELIDWLIDCLI